jgi:hypothetical protein
MRITFSTWPDALINEHGRAEVQMPAQPSRQSGRESKPLDACQAGIGAHANLVA